MKLGGGFGRFVKVEMKIRKYIKKISKSFLITPAE